MIAELQEPIPGRLMGWIHSRYESSNCDRRSSWEVPWNTYHIQQLNPLHWPVVSNIFYFTLSLWGLNVQGKIVFADKAQLYQPDKYSCVVWYLNNYSCWSMLWVKISTINHVFRFYVSLLELCLPKWGFVPKDAGKAVNVDGLILQMKKTYLSFYHTHRDLLIHPTNIEPENRPCSRTIVNQFNTLTCQCEITMSNR
jgi:hypothetical protein